MDDVKLNDDGSWFFPAGQLFRFGEQAVASNIMPVTYRIERWDFGHGCISKLCPGRLQCQLYFVDLYSTGN